VWHIVTPINWQVLFERPLIPFFLMFCMLKSFKFDPAKIFENFKISQIYFYELHLEIWPFHFIRNRFCNSMYLATLLFWPLISNIRKRLICQSPDVTAININECPICHEKKFPLYLRHCKKTSIQVFCLPGRVRFFQCGSRRMTWSKFHQHFTREFFVRKCLAQIFFLLKCN